MPTFKEKLEQKRKELAEKDEKKNQTPTKAKQTSPKTKAKSKTIPKSPKKKRGENSKSRQSQKSTLKPTLDLDRGVYRLLTNVGDKTMTKAELEEKIAEKLLDKSAMATLLRNLASYLESQ